MLKNAEGEGMTIGELIADPSQIANNIKSINDLNEALADLYFYHKDYAATNNLEKAAIIGTYAVAGTLACIFMPEEVKAALGEMTVGDVLETAGLKVNGEVDAWKYADDEIGRILGRVLNVKLADVLDVAHGKKQIAGLYKYDDITVGDVIVAVFDVVDILIEEGVIPAELVEKVRELGRYAAERVLVLNSSITNVQIDDVTVRDILEIANKALEVFGVTAVTENAIYDAVMGYVDGMIGEAVLVTETKAFTPAEIWNVLKANKISEEAVAEIKPVLEAIAGEAGGHVADALVEISALIFVAETTIAQHEMRAVEVGTVTGGAAAILKTLEDVNVAVPAVVYEIL